MPFVTESPTEPVVNVKSYHIFPPIGIARVGDSKAAADASPPGFYLSPDSPQTNFVPDGGLRDADGQMRRMGQLFRIYEFVNGIPVREITADLGKITWSVRLVNTKAADGLNDPISPQSLMIDTGVKVVSGPDQNLPVNGSITPHQDIINVQLGNLLTDDKGRLIVLGGHGTSDKWDDRAQLGALRNPGWYDDTSDGPVTATVQLHGEAESIEAEAAWILVGPPDFAHPMRPIISIYDLADDIALQFGAPPSWQTSFVRHIYPVLQATVFLQWTSSVARQGHAANFGNFLDPDNFSKLHDKNVAGAVQARKTVFAKLRNPAGGGGNMPRLGASPHLTQRQYQHFTQWKDGNFVDDWDPAWSPSNPPQPPLSSYPVSQQPVILTLAALGKGVGASFAPGIEAAEIISKASTYQAPFRIAASRIKPGDLTQKLSVPWQDDFSACTEQWWPSARPGSVFEGANAVEWNRGADNPAGMVANWSKLGFVVPEPGNPQRYVELQRTLP